MIAITKIENPESLAKAHEIRRVVFVMEQNCPPDIEYEFEDESVHFLATVNGAPAGTARWRETENGIKLERFAVLAQYRGMGVGDALVKAVLTDCPHDGRKIYLHAQLTAKDLYAKNNFTPVGPYFWEADIEHVKMVWAGNQQ
jgi:predicted GNAT family N-acyltransferase